MTYLSVFLFPVPVVASPEEHQHRHTVMERAQAYCRADYSPGTLEFKRCVSAYIKKGGIRLEEEQSSPSWHTKMLLFFLVVMLWGIIFFSWYTGWGRNPYRPSNLIDDD